MQPFVLEDFLTLQQENSILETISDHNFPWFYYEGTILPDDYASNNDYVILQGINPPQFSHLIKINNSPYVNTIAPILNTLAAYFGSNLQILKIKFNLLYKMNDNTHHFPHTDVDELENNIKTAIYYVNDSDGETYLFNEMAPKKFDSVTIYKTVMPKKGKMLIFDSSRFHSSSSPTKSNIRIVLNIVFKIKDN